MAGVFSGTSARFQAANRKPPNKQFGRDSKQPTRVRLQTSCPWEIPHSQSGKRHETPIPARFQAANRARRQTASPERFQAPSKKTPKRPFNEILSSAKLEIFCHQSAPRGQPFIRRKRASFFHFRSSLPDVAFFGQGVRNLGNFPSSLRKSMEDFPNSLRNSTSGSGFFAPVGPACLSSRPPFRTYCRSGQDPEFRL